MMQAMVLDAAKRSLRCVAVEVPEPGPGQVLIRVHACAVCRWDVTLAASAEGKPPPATTLS